LVAATALSTPLAAAEARQRLGIRMTAVPARSVGASTLGVMPYAVDPKAADRLWSLSEQLTGVALV